MCADPVHHVRIYGRGVCVVPHGAAGGGRLRRGCVQVGATCAVAVGGCLGPLPHLPARLPGPLGRQVSALPCSRTTALTLCLSRLPQGGPCSMRRPNFCYQHRCRLYYTETCSMHAQRAGHHAFCFACHLLLKYAAATSSHANSQIAWCSKF